MGCLHMGNLYETIHALCVRKGVTDSRMCTDIGISRGIMSDLKTGRKSGVSAKTLNKIADYFGVSMSYLLGTEKAAVQKDSGYVQDDEDTEEYIRLISQLSSDGRRGAIIDLRKRLAYELLQGSEDTQE